jgi:thioredoxin 1
VSLLEIQSEEEFNEKVKLLAVVEFYGDFCPACKMAIPVVERLAEVFKDVVDIYQYKIEGNEGIRLGVLSTPTFVVYKDGQKAISIVGLPSAAELIDEIKRALEK